MARLQTGPERRARRPARHTVTESCGFSLLSLSLNRALLGSKRGDLSCRSRDRRTPWCRRTGFISAAGLQPALACMPAALFHAVVDLLLLADVRVDQVGDLVWMKRIEDSPVGLEAMVGRARVERKQNGKGGPAVNIQEPMRCMRNHHALRSAP